MADKIRYYWDACAWIALIQQEPGRFDSLKYIAEEAKAGRVEIWTSNFTLAEVYKRPIDSGQISLLPENDKAFEDSILQAFVQRVQVDYDVGVLARALLRRYPGIQKPQDGIHLATALLNNVDEIHTYDRQNLLDLDGLIARRDGKMLKICVPPKPPTTEPIKQSPMEEWIEKAKDNEGKTAQGGSAKG